MLYKFTEEETLEGQIYRCEKCNGKVSVETETNTHTPLSIIYQSAQKETHLLVEIILRFS